MNDPRQFGANLNALKEVRQLSLTKFSAELHIHRTTLQAVLNGGQTTLDTACRIANASHIPLSVLTDETTSAECLDALQCWLTCMDWYSSLSAEKQKIAYRGIQQLLEAVRK